MGRMRSEGRRLGIDESRRLVLDVLHYSADVPCFPVEQLMDMRQVARLRSQTNSRISWTVLFAKAYGRVACEIPLLRRAYLAWPWPHLFEYSGSVATIAVNRQYRGDNRLFWARLPRPEESSLLDLQHQLERFQTAPVEQVFDRHLLMSRLPTLARRILWWSRLNLAPRQRARRIGTFGMSSMAGLGVYNRLHPHFLTSSLSFGPLQDDGGMLVSVLCDHRVLDGVPAAQAINRLEEVLRGEIAEELGTLIRRPAATDRRKSA